MIGAHQGLVDVKTDDLRKALRHLHRGDLDVPVTAIGLTRVGLQHCSGALLAQLRELDSAGVRAVLVCVLAERAERARRAEAPADPTG